MPHGSGHAGGGHHGGGGGHHHHHHHHHGGGYHHHHHSYALAYGGPYYRYGYRRRSLGWGFFWIAVVGTAITLAAIFSIRYGVPNDNSSSNNYAPNETRAFTYSAAFCDSITATFDKPSFSMDTATLYVLSQTPPLKDHDSFNFTNTVSFDFSANYHHWYFYLYPGSVYSMSVCKDDSSFFTLSYVLIKGEGNFNNWADSPWSSHHKVIKSGSVTDLCSSTSKTTHTYNVNSEGEYYWAFYSSGISVSATVDIEVHRTKYLVDPGTIISNCTTDYRYNSFCVADIPLGNSIGLVSLYSTDDNIDWSSEVSVSINCHARIWVYVAISLAGVGFFALIMVFIVACCCFLAHRNKKYTQLRGDNQTPSTPIVTPVPAPTTATYATGTVPPPPYNPSYGSTGTASQKYY